MYQYIKTRPLQLCILGRNVQRRLAFRSIYQEVEKIETLVDMTNFEIDFLGDDTKHSKTRCSCKLGS